MPPNPLRGRGKVNEGFLIFRFSVNSLFVTNFFSIAQHFSLHNFFSDEKFEEAFSESESSLSPPPTPLQRRTSKIEKELGNLKGQLAKSSNRHNAIEKRMTSTSQRTDARVEELEAQLKSSRNDFESLNSAFKKLQTNYKKLQLKSNEFEVRLKALESTQRRVRQAFNPSQGSRGRGR